jgi:hypothetical protein
MTARRIAGPLVLLTIAALILLLRPLRIGVAVLAGLVVTGWVCHALYGYWLRSRWNRTWGRAGKRILLVYSRSPNWQEYIEQNWLPRLEGRAVLLDWSDRATWRRPVPLEVRAFRYWAGHREFNPLAILFPERGRVGTVRFWRAFREFKHGRDMELRKAERELFGFASGAESR